MTLLCMPAWYVPPLGGPLYWGDEQSGVLPTAVQAYFASTVGQGPRLSREQWELVIGYCLYYINAPCWDQNPHHTDETRAELAALRRKMRQITPDNALETLDHWIQSCLDVGIDPL